jgi:hypothetical protein
MRTTRSLYERQRNSCRASGVLDHRVTTTQTSVADRALDRCASHPVLHAPRRIREFELDQHPRRTIRHHTYKLDQRSVPNASQRTIGREPSWRRCERVCQFCAEAGTLIREWLGALDGVAKRFDRFVELASLPHQPVELLFEPSLGANFYVFDQMENVIDREVGVLAKHDERKALDDVRSVLAAQTVASARSDQSAALPKVQR